MLIDTHCHLNILVKKSFKEFDTPLKQEELIEVDRIVREASHAGVTKILNVGTSLVESINCITLASRYSTVYAAVGIHPNDLAYDWQDDLNTLEGYLKEKDLHKVVAIGECGIDKHYPDYNIERQKDAFKRQIELALTYDLPLVIHSRDAPEETYSCLAEFKSSSLRGTIHCFSENSFWAQQALSLGFVLGVGGTVTYPKNNDLRAAVQTVGIENIVLETDAPFLPLQAMRGKKNHPRFIAPLADYIAALFQIETTEVARVTTATAEKLFKL